VSARITPRARHADTHAGALEAALADKAHLVYRIALEHKRPPDGWRTFQDLDVANDADDPLAPDEIRDDVLGYIRAELEQNGPAKFRATFYGRKDDGSETRVAFVEAGLDPPATADVRATAESNAVIATNELLRRHAEDEHKQKMEMFRVAIEIPKTTVEVLKAMPEALGKSDKHYEMLSKAIGYHYYDRDEERALRERIEDNKARFATIEKAFAKVEPLIEKLGLMWLAKIMADMGVPMDGSIPTDARPSEGGVTVKQEPSKKAQTLKKFCESLTRDEKIQILEKLGDAGEDALAVLFGAGEAPTDQSCDALLRKLKEVLAGRDTMWIAMTLRSIVGDRVVPLLPILKPIWEET